jgi:hypothetical protein
MVGSSPIMMEDNLALVSARTRASMKIKFRE